MTEPGGHTYEQAQTYRAAIFDLVADPINWKNPIDKYVKYSPALHDAVIDAVIHFTGSVPTVEVMGGVMRVRAAGYYEAVGP